MSAPADAHGDDDGELSPELSALVDRAVEAFAREQQAIERWWQALGPIDRLAVYRLATGDLALDELHRQ